MQLTILMPCLNEAETLALCIHKAKAWASHGIGDVLDYRDKFFSSLLIIFETAGVVKLKIKERGSRYFFICFYIRLEKYLARDNYRKG